MEKAILLSVVASLCTATSSICQRTGASRDDVRDFVGLMGYAKSAVLRSEEFGRFEKYSC